MMNDVARIMSAERLKLSRRKAAWMVPAATGALSALVSIAVAYAAARDWVGVPSGFFTASATIGYLVNAAGIAAIMMTCFSVSGEFSMGTVKPAWVRGVRRDGWFAGKLLWAASSVVALFLIAVIVAVAIAGLRYRFTALHENTYLVHTAARLGRALAVSTLLTTAALIAVTAAAGAVAAAVNRAGTAIALCIALAIGLGVLSVFEPLRPLLLTSVITLPFEQMSAMAKGLPLPLEWTTLAWRTLACSGAWAAAAFLAGRFVIMRKEITF